MSSATCALTIVETLRELGIRHAVLCPGSRSAPLAIALAEAAREGAIDLHVRIDERAAGFLALGLAQSLPTDDDERAVVPIITTSGTAVGNLVPAVMEASHAGIPLMVVSADRPSSMVHTGANQTTDQTRIFGDFVRADARISSQEGDPATWSFQVSRLAALATGTLTRDPGPVHLNAAFAEPLLPQGRAQATGGAAAHVHPTLAADDAYVLHDDAPTVVLVGAATPQVGRRARRFAEDARLPLLAEPTSNARSGEAIRTYRLLLESSLGKEIRRVVVFGHPTLSRPVSRLLARTDVQLVIVADSPRWGAPRGRAVVVPGVTHGPADPTWRDRWRSDDAAVSARVDTLVQDGPLTGQAVAAAVVASLGGGVLVAGSSNPIRDLDLAPVPERGATAYANRGLAGIDGTIATAQGIAFATGSPTTALMGDLTFLHDVGGLLIGPLERRPDLRIVVANDDGGSIFHTLEQGGPDHERSFERVFGTPTGVAVEPLARAYGWAYARAGSLTELESLLSKPIRGTEVIEVPLSRDGRRVLDERLRALSDAVGQPE
ncbi:2-succinyl-5-enolpyruvyl-6-hydroxy-3-cyclohexene-1-carboxylic-acid synthase [Mariniluteicoccus flavus]